MQAWVATPTESLTGFHVSSCPYQGTPKVCKIMAFMAVIMGLGLLFYILLGFRYQGTIKGGT